MYVFLKLILAMSLPLCIFNTVAAQQKLYTPLNIDSAYSRGTRSYDGMPGINYWQNSADYKINAELDPKTRLLTGREEIKYSNNSPDTLKKLVVRLYQDFYRSHSSRDFEITPDYFTDGVHLASIKINGNVIDMKDHNKFSRSKSNMNIVPALPVLPNTIVTLEIEWRFTVSSGAPIRTGTYDSTTFFIAYWYPQVSVYDDVSGWDEFNFGGEQEFYNDHNNFDVKITVPAGSAIWATGILQNPEEVLNEPFYSRYSDALQSDSIIRIIQKSDLQKEIFKNNNGKVSWHYKADKVPDFTFAASSHYLWDAVSIKPDSISERRTYIAAVYRETSKDFYRVAEIAKRTLNYFSKELPGVPYPYPSLTVFNGSGGMEFPMMINDGSEPDYEEALRLTSHEAAHQYFPFFMGTNEKKYAWMDEGLAVMIPSGFQERNGKQVWQVITDKYEKFAGNELEMPMMIPSILTTGNTYRVASYNRPACAYEILRDFLGGDLFRKSLQEYIARWKLKHPIPYDFFYTFNETTGEDLSWFWKPWFFEHGHPDLAIKDVQTSAGNISIIIENRGTLPLPVRLVILGEGNENKEIYETADIWKNNKSELIIKQDIDFKIRKILLGDFKIPDVNRADNEWNDNNYD